MFPYGFMLLAMVALIIVFVAITIRDRRRRNP